MTNRRRAIDVELLILLIAFIVLTTAAQTSRRMLNLDMMEVEHTPTAAVRISAEHHLAAAANPHWAPAHAFTRRLAPVFSSSAAPADGSADAPSSSR